MTNPLSVLSCGAKGSGGGGDGGGGSAGEGDGQGGGGDGIGGSGDGCKGEGGGGEGAATTAFSITGTPGVETALIPMKVPLDAESLIAADTPSNADCAAAELDVWILAVTVNEGDTVLL